MPNRHFRSEMRGRPPCSLGTGAGRTNSITWHKLSGTARVASEFFGKSMFLLDATAGIGFVTGSKVPRRKEALMKRRSW
jgi:hypothetical protein